MKKSVSKRIKVTKTGKLLHRPIAVNHLKAKRSGQKNQLKRGEKYLKEDLGKSIRQLLNKNI